MKFIPNAVSTKVARTILLSQKNSPQMLFAGGLVGMGATVVLACKATLKIDEVLDELQENLEKIEAHRGDVYGKGEVYDDHDADLDKKKLKVKAGLKLVKLYSPAIVCGAVSIAAITQSHNILSRRNAALIAAYGTIEKAFQEYRDRVMAEIGEDREKELYYDVVACEIDDEDKPGKAKAVKRTRGTNMYARLFDEHNRNYEPTPEYNVAFLKCKQNYLNDRLQARGHMFLNEVYDELGMDRSKEGAVVGWLKNGKDNFIDFGIWQNNDQERVIEFMTGREKSIWLDFNVDGVIYDKI